MSPQSKTAAVETDKKKPILRWTLVTLAILVVLTFAWVRWVYGQIQWYASRDMANMNSRFTCTT